MGYWKYEIVHDYDATKLINEFREENLKLKNSKGIGDDELDFIMYAEKDDHTISLGRVLLVKMSDAMVEYYYQNKDPKYFYQNFGLNTSTRKPKIIILFSSRKKKFRMLF